MDDAILNRVRRIVADVLGVSEATVWLAPVFLGDEVELTLEVRHKSEGTRSRGVAVAERVESAIAG